MSLRTTDRFYRVPSAAICYLRYTIESYDGIAVVSTVNPAEGLILVQTAPGCEDILDDLINHFITKEGIPIQLVDEAGLKDDKR